jgi:hypothetical protein
MGFDYIAYVGVMRIQNRLRLSYVTHYIVPFIKYWLH